MVKIANQPPATFGRIIEANEVQRPNHPAFEMGERSQTFAQYAARARRLSGALHRAGARKQDRIATLSQNSIEQMEIYGACELAGFVAAGVNFRLIRNEIAYQIEDCQARIFLFEARYAPLVDEIRAQLGTVVQFVCIGAALDWAMEYEAFLAAGDADGAPFRAEEDDLAYLVYTSGTTGRPKGCMQAHGTQIHVVMGCSADMGINRVDRVMVVMPLFHVGGKVVQCSASWQGATTVILDRFEPDDYLRALQDRRITVGHLAPPMILGLLERPLATQLDFSALRLILYSAAAMPSPVLRQAIKTFGRVFQNQYGLSEGAGLSLNRLEHDPDGDAVAQRRLRSIGIPFAGAQVRIADDQGEAQPVGTPGEILLRSPGNMVGYWNNAAASIDALRDGWLHTGDIGVLDEDGYCYLVDRKKDMIVSGGENIYSREVEEVLFAHPGILEAAVIGIPDDKWGEAVRAIVVRRDGHSVEEADVIAHCRASLASYKKPRSVLFTDALPRLASGKIDKVRIRQDFGIVPASAI